MEVMPQPYKPEADTVHLTVCIPAHVELSVGLAAIYLCTLCRDWLCKAGTKTNTETH